MGDQIAERFVKKDVLSSTPALDDKKQDIVDILVKKGLVHKDQAESLRSKAKTEDKSIDQVLEETEILPERTLTKAYSLLYGLPFVNLSDYHIPYNVISRVPEEMAKKEYIIAFEAHDGIIKVAVAKPYRLKKSEEGVIASYKEKEKVDIKLYLATKKDVEEAFKYYHQGTTKQVIVQDQPQNTSFSSLAKPTTEGAGVGSEEVAPQQKQVLRTILDVLLAQKVIDQKQFKKVHDKAVEQQKPYEYILRQEKIIPAEALAKSLGFLYKLPYISLKNIEIPFQVINKFPQNIAAEYQMVVFDAIGNNVLKVATAAPENRQVKEIVDFIRKRNNIEIDLFVATPEDIERAMVAYNKAPKGKAVQPSKITAERQQLAPPSKPEPQPRMVADEDKPVADMGKEDVKEAIGELDIGSMLSGDITSVDQLKQIIAGGLVPKIVAATINFALKKKASDVHIEPTFGKVRLRYRIDGILRDIAVVPKSLHPAIVSRIKISSHLRIDEQRVPQDGRFDVSFKGGVVDIRVSTLPTVNGEKVVMRLLDKSKGIISLEKLGLTGEPYKKVLKNIKKPYGMILSTGPTGSGKTTSLYAVIQYINSSEVNIVTLEDPVEYEIAGVNHCQARPEIGFSFADGLRSILRQDPNVIMIGEIRDKETAGMAVHAALTGHLVLSTLHTNDAGGAVPRLVDMGIEPFLIASSTNLVIAQRLARKICSNCKEKVVLPPAVMKEIEEEVAKIPKEAKVDLKQPLEFYRGRGCNQCTSGYSGRIGLFEVLEMSPRLDKIAIRHGSGEELTKAAIEEGMITMKQDGIIKAAQGITTIDEVMRVTIVNE